MPSTSITELLKNKLLQLDLEFGDAEGFFSASKSGLHILISEQSEKSLNYEAKIRDTTISINDSTSNKGNELNRNTQFILKTDSNLFDLVSRFVVLSNDRCARIAGNEIQHNCKNIYHQHSTNDVIVPAGTDDYLQFKDLNSTGHLNFKNVFYIRDEGIEKNGMKRWIVHHRMIVDQHAADLIVRCCHPILEGPLPLQRIIPAGMKRKLFRIRERKLPNFPLMAVGEVLVKKDYSFNIGTRVQILNDSYTAT